MLCEELGRLLSALPIYVKGVFDDDAIVGNIKNSSKNASIDFLLCITIMINVRNIESKELEKKLSILESLIYNPAKHSDYVLSQVYIGYDFYE